MMIDVKDCVCASCDKHVAWQVIDSVEVGESTEGQKRIVKGPFIKVGLCSTCFQSKPQLRTHPRPIKDNGSVHFDVPDSPPRT